MIAVLIMITGLTVLVAWFCLPGRRSISAVGSIRFNSVAIGKIHSTWTLPGVLVVLSFICAHVTVGPSHSYKPALALLQPMPWLDLFDTVDEKPSTFLDTSTEPQPRKPAAAYAAPHHLEVFFDYEEGLANARRLEKPLLIHFTRHDCRQSRDIETKVWADPDVLGYLANEYVVVQLYVDDKTPLPLHEHAISPHTGKPITTVGHRWDDLQAVRFGTDAQPYYTVLSPSGKELIPGTGAEYNIDAYADFLASGVKAYHARTKSIL